MTTVTVGAAPAPPSSISNPPATATPVAEIEVSIVLPCLNERETIATCVDKATRCLQEHGVVGEVVVADNGSTDGSRDIAREHGA